MYLPSIKQSGANTSRLEFSCKCDMSKYTRVYYVARCFARLMLILNKTHLNEVANYFEEHFFFCASIVVERTAQDCSLRQTLTSLAKQAIFEDT